MKRFRGLMMVPAVALSVALGAPGVSATTTAQLAPPAVLNEDGTVSVPVEYTCDVGRTAFVQIFLELRKGQTYTSGNGTISGLGCSGTRQVVDVLVRPHWGPFDNGRALAMMTFSAGEQVKEAGMIRIGN